MHIAPHIEPDLEDAPFAMANLSPDETGLPFVVWISPQGGGRHDVRVKVTCGPRWAPPIVSVALRPTPKVIEGELPASDFALIAAWLELNRDALVAFWTGETAYTHQVLARLKKLPG